MTSRALPCASVPIGMIMISVDGSPWSCLERASLSIPTQNHDSQPTLAFFRGLPIYRTHVPRDGAH